jgi:hypothetical protein
MQDEVVAHLANALSVQLPSAEAPRAERAQNPDSMDLCLLPLSDSRSPAASRMIAWLNVSPGPRWRASLSTTAGSSQIWRKPLVISGSKATVPMGSVATMAS